MKYLVISGNPKKDGLCASVCDEIIRGAKDGGAETELLVPGGLERCHVCGDGWGTCRAQHYCTFGHDGFTEAQQKIQQADQFCFITPVYWSEMAEALKCFFDRLRRCEALVFASRDVRPPVLEGKQVLLVASPGGSGNGAVECLDQMDRFCRHTGAVIFDYISVNRWNHDYKKTAAYAAARAMAEGRLAGKSLYIVH
ncbi:MAG: flavodoxin family protein [Treponema sp.]|jgi:multimeric flavodoxin WrbA|nr:flavodoxin family protein [Treponema sp.]